MFVYNIISTHVLAFFISFYRNTINFNFHGPYTLRSGSCEVFLHLIFLTFLFGWVLCWQEKENMIRTATPKEESIKIDNFCATLKRSSLHHRTAQQQLTVQPALCRALNFRLQSIIQDYIAPRCRREPRNYKLFFILFHSPSPLTHSQLQLAHPARRRCRRDKTSLFHFDIRSWLGCFQCCVISKEPRDVN